MTLMRTCLGPGVGMGTSRMVTMGPNATTASFILSVVVGKVSCFVCNSSRDDEKDAKMDAEDQRQLGSSHSYLPWESVPLIKSSTLATRCRLPTKVEPRLSVEYSIEALKLYSRIWRRSLSTHMKLCLLA